MTGPQCLRIPGWTEIACTGQQLIRDQEKEASTKRQASSKESTWLLRNPMIKDNYVYTSFYAQWTLQDLQDREGISWVRTGPQFTRRAKAPLAWFCFWLQSCGPQNQQDFGWEKILIFKTQARKRLAKLKKKKKKATSYKLQAPSSKRHEKDTIK